MGAVPLLSAGVEQLSQGSPRFCFCTTGRTLFQGANKKTLPVSTASGTLQGLFRQAGLQQVRGCIGPRLYDLRHAFAVHRLTQWYRQGVNLHARLRWLSAYMGHVNILGTETYLKATPQLLSCWDL
jgi:integrase/recombinase XerD